MRLVRRGEFESVYRGGRRRSSSQFVIFFRPNETERSRFGISVKKALGGAVVRNRIRRRIREMLRLHASEISPGWDIVIHPRASVARIDFSQLAAEFIGLLRSALR
jgi:ribonuclease P protein component